MLTSGRGLKLSALLAAATVALAVVVACNSNGENQPTPPGASPFPTIEARPTLTPGAYQPPPGTANLLGNGGLEEGTQYWFALHEQTVQTADVAHSGQASAHLHMQDGPEATEGKVYYLVQEVAPAEFPELISGYYRIDNWQRGTEKQYLQFVVIVFASTNLTTNKQGAPLSTPYPNYQIRYPLVGISEEPFAIGNAFFKFLSRDLEPRQGEWVYFESNIKNDFQQLWKVVPEGYSKIRVLFEVRYDDKAPGNAAEADVYYDDLYMGPANANPNQP
jgi:hypothetical protein